MATGSGFDQNTRIWLLQNRGNKQSDIWQVDRYTLVVAAIDSGAPAQTGTTQVTICFLEELDI